MQAKHNTHTHTHTKLLQVDTSAYICHPHLGTYGPELGLMYPASHSIDGGGQAVGKPPLLAGGAPLHTRHVLQGAEAAGPAGACALPARHAGAWGSARAAEAASAHRDRHVHLRPAPSRRGARRLRRLPSRSCRVRRRRRRARRCTHRAAPSSGVLVHQRAGIAAPRHVLLPGYQRTYKVTPVSARALHHMQAKQSRNSWHMKCILIICEGELSCNTATCSGCRLARQLPPPSAHQSSPLTQAAECV